METSVKTGFAQISLIAQKIPSRPKIWGGGGEVLQSPSPMARTPMVHTPGNKSLRQNINEPMRDRHMVPHIELENKCIFYLNLPNVRM